MSGRLPNASQMHVLPEELLVEIFLHLDAAGILACRATCRYWRHKLSSYEFLLQLAKKWLAKESHIFIHFGYSLAEQLSVDWIMNLDPLTGQVFQFQFPFSLTQRGWFDLIGVDNGLFYVRYCEDGGESVITIWNPATGQRVEMEDPLQHHCPDCQYQYALVFFPASDEYAVLHISKEHDDSGPPTLKMYASFRRNWDVQVACPQFVRRLNPSCVAIEGVVYWITYGGYEGDEEPPYIVSFSCLDCTFEQIFLPIEAASHCQELLVRQGRLCLDVNNHNEETFRTDMWQLNEVHGNRSWSWLYMFEGVGPTYRPFLILEEDEIQIMERHMGVFGLEYINITHFHITRYGVAEQERRNLQSIEYNEDVKFRDQIVSRHPVKVIWLLK
ncbi:hypothetical protein PIB30_032224 [Stylosanthes scabra]|uniref:F-box domain-containing protein n=1 Tax=Stylosanthes scabra TaxID=79078 RepID=A0ABU6TD65_9FABA|nr:hypothetical protein [Stylosanthes scabra]